MTEIVLPTTEQARTLTDRIKIAVEGTWQLIQEAYTSRTWAVLGYDTWDAYCSAEFGETRLRLPKEERQEVVASLRDSGLSTRAIASATGHSDWTVRDDLRRGARNLAPTAVTGTDGKTYNPRVVQSYADSMADDGWTRSAEPIARPDTPPLDGQHRLESLLGSESIDESAPTPQRAPDRTPRVDVARTVLVALTELRQARESLQALTAVNLARQDEETRSIWAARLNTELEALHGFHKALIKENSQ